MQVGDLICLCPVAYPDTTGVLLKILTRDQHGPLDVDVLSDGRIETWEADEAEVINASR